MPKLLLTIPPALQNRIDHAMNFGGYASKTELIRHAVSLLLDDQEKRWASQMAQRDAMLLQRRYLKTS